jgi:hypothetical protein
MIALQGSGLKKGLQSFAMKSAHAAEEAAGSLASALRLQLLARNTLSWQHPFHRGDNACENILCEKRHNCSY